MYLIVPVYLDFDGREGERESEREREGGREGEERYTRRLVPVPVVTN